MHLRAFIVDDSSTVRDNLIETLKELAQVEPAGIAETEHEAKRWAADNAGWDVAIVDLFLREGSGMNVVEALRQRNPNQQVIVLSNHATRDVRWRCAQLGADAVFDKSSEIDALIDYCLRRSNSVAQQAAPAAGGR